MKLTIYTKDYCPYCDAAKNLLKSIGAEYKEIDITHTPKVMQELVQKSGMMTVPQIFVDDECLGGFDDINALHQAGKLKTKLGLS
ncbi:glutaredoxin 3 [Candidatus Peregrinibacteria bacterium]|nr:MAG: glutaredoxin 3 [Candidatus Peregrinibacteria bacterium]